MSDEWQLPVPKEDPEARPASLDSGGGGCPFPMPDVDIVEDEDDGGNAGGVNRDLGRDQ
jgi:hypothetical protein